MWKNALRHVVIVNYYSIEKEKLEREYSYFSINFPLTSQITNDLSCRRSNSVPIVQFAFLDVPHCRIQIEILTARR